MGHRERRGGEGIEGWVIGRKEGEVRGIKRQAI